MYQIPPVHEMDDEAIMSALLERKGFYTCDDRKDTARRFIKALNVFLENEGKKPEDAGLKITTFDLENKNTITVRDIVVYSLCEHHLFPFKNIIEVQYRPHGKVLGLSKIPRIARFYGQQCTSAEKLADAIARDIFERGMRSVYVRIKSYHTCCCARGVEKEVEMITEASYEM